MSNYYTVIMAGGRGERFWPESLKARPKHLLAIVGDKPMLAQTVERLSGLVPTERVFVLTNAEHVAAVRAVCPEIPAEQIIGEPVGRDTAPAAALAALLVRRRDPDGVMALLAADAAIHDAAGFRSTMEAAFSAAATQDYIFTVGVPPAFPATAYGYLRLGPKVGESMGHSWFHVDKFVEKPDRPTAERYLKEGTYLWNAGIFVVRAKVLEAALVKYATVIADGMKAVDALLDQGASLPAALAAVYPGLTKISVDFAVMEKAANVAVFKATFDWDDVGEWPAIFRHAVKDPEGNVIGRSEAIFHEAKGNIVRSTPDHLVALLGVNDLVVVHTDKVTLVCPRDRAQELKQLLQKLGAKPDGAQWL